MSGIFGFGIENLKYVNRLKRRVFYCIISLVIIINIFISTALNLYKISALNEEKNFVVVDLKVDTPQEAKEKLEDVFWSLKGVHQVIYHSKEQSFRDLQEQLNISIPMKDNPLTDSFIVYLKGNKSLEQIREAIEDQEVVKEVFQDVEYAKQIQKNKEAYTMLSYVAGGAALLLFVLLIYLFKVAAALDFFNCINVIRDDKYNLGRAKRRNLIPFTLSALLGQVIFFNIYVLVRKNFIYHQSDFFLLEYWNSFLWHGAFFLVLNVVVWVLPISLAGIDGERE